MKRVALTLVCMLVLLTVALPCVALATEAKTTAAATTATATTGALIVYPTAPADATAAQAKASTQWQKPGDVMNLVIALVSVVAVFGIVIWGIYATSRISRA
jgi:hypothetical protein